MSELRSTELPRFLQPLYLSTKYEDQPGYEHVPSGYYNFLLDLVVTTSSDAAIIDHELVHRYTIAGSRLEGPSPFNTMRNLVSLSYLVLAQMSRFGQPSMVDPDVDGANGELFTQIEELIRGAWKHLAPMAELLAIDLSETRDLLRHNYGDPNVRKKIAAAGERYGVDLQQAWEALRSIDDHTIRRLILRMCLRAIGPFPSTDESPFRVTWGDPISQLNAIVETVRELLAQGARSRALDTIRSIETPMADATMNLMKQMTRYVVARISATSEPSKLAILSAMVSYSIADSVCDAMSCLLIKEMVDSGIFSLDVGKEMIRELYREEMSFLPGVHHFLSSANPPLTGSKLAEFNADLLDLSKPLITFEYFADTRHIHINASRLNVLAKMPINDMNYRPLDLLKILMYFEKCREILVEDSSAARRCPLLGYQVFLGNEIVRCDLSCVLRTLPGTKCR